LEIVGFQKGFKAVCHPQEKMVTINDMRPAGTNDVVEWFYAAGISREPINNLAPQQPGNEPPQWSAGVFLTMARPLFFSAGYKQHCY
jgi:hypothetical protein